MPACTCCLQIALMHLLRGQEGVARVLGDFEEEKYFYIVVVSAMLEIFHQLAAGHCCIVRDGLGGRCLQLDQPARLTDCLLPPWLPPPPLQAGVVRRRRPVPPLHRAAGPAGHALDLHQGVYAVCAVCFVRCVLCTVHGG